jgi:hypothetical protein
MVFLESSLGFIPLGRFFSIEEWYGIYFTKRNLIYGLH